MSEPETGFENAKSGDRCFSTLFACKSKNEKTNAMIQDIKGFEVCPIKVVPDIMCEHVSPSFTFSGRYSEDGGQCLFWENPIKEIPTRPKRKVTKKGWIGIHIESDELEHKIARTSNIYRSATDADTYGYLRKPYQLKEIEFEVEE